MKRDEWQRQAGATINPQLKKQRRNPAGLQELRRVHVAMSDGAREKKVYGPAYSHYTTRVPFQRCGRILISKVVLSEGM